ncbi:1518_t:CDS:2, partial [Funneliformis mosseae]
MQLAKEYGISDSAVSEFLKKSEHWLSIDTTLSNANNFYKKLSNFSQIEEAVSISIWVDHFLASEGWLNNFKHRNNLHTFKIRKEADSASINKISQMKIELQETKAEILSDDNNFNISDNNDDIEKDNIEELQSLINELPFTDPLNMKEYININDKLIVEEELLLEEIVNIIIDQAVVEEVK